jgi:NAD(P)-dependent dehydrogenase (short-subunit alcohol dehydrogenase family)
MLNLFRKIKKTHPARIEGRTAIITGGGSGLGRATAILFAQHGGKIVIGDINDENGCKTVDIIKKGGGEAKFTHIDVSCEESVKKSISESKSSIGNASILFIVQELIWRVIF